MKEGKICLVKVENWSFGYAAALLYNGNYYDIEVFDEERRYVPANGEFGWNLTNNVVDTVFGWTELLDDELVEYLEDGDTL